jgi:hypothetical protein
MKNTITIPVSSHVKKFLVHRYGNQPITLTRKNQLGNFIAGFLSSTDYHIHKTPQKLTDSVSFVLNSRFKKNKSFLTEENAKKLSYFFDQEFKKDFCNHIDFYMVFGFTMEEAMKDFSKKYGIEEEEYSIFTMRRYYQRYGTPLAERQAKKKSLKPKKSFPDNVAQNINILGSKYNEFKTKQAMTFSLQRVQPALAVAV